MNSILSAAALAIASTAAAQPAPAFEVATIKVSPPRTGAAGTIAFSSDPAMFRLSNTTLKILVAMAYGTSDRLVAGGPAWVDEQFYDVVAKLPPDTAKERTADMLQTLLAERFNLKVHREQRERRAYALVLAKEAPELKAGGEPGSGMTGILPGRIVGKSVTAGVLADALSRTLGQEVVDQTGLQGSYEIDLKWTPEDSRKDQGPDIFTALRRIGFKLETTKTMVEMIVVDHADRIPAEN